MNAERIREQSPWNTTCSVRIQESLQMIQKLPRQQIIKTWLKSQQTSWIWIKVTINAMIFQNLMMVMNQCIILLELVNNA